MKEWDGVVRCLGGGDVDGDGDRWCGDDFEGEGDEVVEGVRI